MVYNTSIHKCIVYTNILRLREEICEEDKVSFMCVIDRIYMDVKENIYSNSELFLSTFMSNVN